MSTPDHESHEQADAHNRHIFGPNIVAYKSDHGLYDLRIV